LHIWALGLPLVFYFDELGLPLSLLKFILNDLELDEFSLKKKWAILDSTMDGFIFFHSYLILPV
jgi:hypothetical protein